MFPGKHLLVNGQERKVKENRRVFEKEKPLKNHRLKEENHKERKALQINQRSQRLLANQKESAVIVETKPHVPPEKQTESAVSEGTAKAATPSMEPVTEKQETKPPLRLASKFRKLDFSMPAKPERPLNLRPKGLQWRMTKMRTCKLLYTVLSTSSPHPPSGAQSSEPKGTIDLDQQESDLLTQLDSLMEESLRLKTLPKPTVRDKSRVRSIGTVMKDIEVKLNEIAPQKEEQAASKVRRTQDRSVPSTIASDTSVPPKGKEVSVEAKVQVKPVTPPTMQPLTGETDGWIYTTSCS